MHVETDLQHCPLTSSSATAPTVCVKMQPKSNVQWLFNGTVSNSVSKISDTRLQCNDNSSANATKIDVDPATVFHLSQDDFSEDIDDISFADLPLHSEFLNCSKSSSVASDCRQAIATASNIALSSSVLTSNVSRAHCLQSANDCVTERRNITNTVSCLGKHPNFDKHIPHQKV